MKVCMIVRAMPWHRLGGLEFHVLDLCNSLCKLGCKITIITTQEAVGSAAEQHSAFNIISVPGTTPGDYSVGFFRKLNRVVAEAHSLYDFDIIHAQDLAGLFLKAPKAAPVVVTVHGTLFSETTVDRRVRSHLSLARQISALWHYKHRLLLTRAFRTMLRRTERLVVDSEFTFRELLLINSTLRAKCRVVPLALDIDRYPEVAPKRGETSGKVLQIALLGRVQESKGLGIVLEVARLCKARRLPVVFNLGGSGDFLDKLRTKVAGYGLESTVVIHGRIAPEELPRFMASNDLFLFPDLTHPAFGLVALEAMRYALPVIGTTNGAIPETVSEEVGWTYSAWDVDELLELLIRLVEDPQLVAEKGRAALTEFQKRTAIDMASDTMKVYAEVAKRN